MKVPRILIAAPFSGSGKTAVSCALMSAFQSNGLCVHACKCGPDYIDPMFHREVLGLDSRNLDLFFSEEKELTDGFIRHASGADLTVTEGVMGYYDGQALDVPGLRRVVYEEELPKMTTLVCTDGLLAPGRFYGRRLCEFTSPELPARLRASSPVGAAFLDASFLPWTPVPPDRAAAWAGGEHVVLVQDERFSSKLPAVRRFLTGFWGDPPAPLRLRQVYRRDTGQQGSPLREELYLPFGAWTFRGRTPASGLDAEPGLR